MILDEPAPRSEVVQLDAVRTISTEPILIHGFHIDNDAPIAAAEIEVEDKDGNHIITLQAGLSLFASVDINIPFLADNGLVFPATDSDLFVTVFYAPTSS